MRLRYQEATNAVTVRRATPLNERIHRLPPRVDTPNLGLHGEHFPLCGSENYFSTLEIKGPWWGKAETWSHSHNRKGSHSYRASPWGVRHLCLTSDTWTFEAWNGNTIPQTSVFENQQASYPGDPKTIINRDSALEGLKLQTNTGTKHKGSRKAFRLYVEKTHLLTSKCPLGFSLGTEALSDASFLFSLCFASTSRSM